MIVYELFVDAWERPGYYPTLAEAKAAARDSGEDDFLIDRCTITDAYRGRALACRLLDGEGVFSEQVRVVSSGHWAKAPDPRPIVLGEAS